MAKHLTLTERAFIERALAQDYSFAYIGKVLDRSDTTIAREVKLSPSQKSRHEKALKSGMRRSFSWVFKSAREASCESCPQAARAARAAAKVTNQSIDAGFAIESRFTDLSTGCPSRIFRTGTSSFLPDSVRGTSRIANTSLGTWRADRRVRIAPSSRSRRSAS